MIRWEMIRVLLDREVRRLQKNPSALMLIGLLTAVAVLLATSKPVDEQGGGGSSASAPPAPVILVYEERTEWVDYLLRNLPESPEVTAIPVDQVRKSQGHFQIPQGYALVEVQRSQRQDWNGYQITGHYTGASATTLKPFYDWFWPTLTFYHSQPDLFEQQDVPLNPAAAQMKSLQETSVAELVQTELIGTMLVLVVQFFTCCHLLVSFTSQDRERGTLMALVLSPAKMSEILVAKFLFHLVLSVLGSVLIISILQPAALVRPLFWLVLLTTSVGLMCVGTCISTLTKTQSAAGLLALCYMLAGALLFYLASRFTAFAFLKKLAFESYSFPLLYGTLKANIGVMSVTKSLGNMAAIVAFWMLFARHSFYRYGWR
jgi:hypothetical protein